MKQEKDIKPRKKRNKKNEQSDILENKIRELRNRETNIISFVFLGIFMIMIGYLVYFNFNTAPYIINNSYNHRIDNKENEIIRGNIVASDGTVIATNKKDEEGNSVRVYPFDNLYSHVVGINGEVKTGLEKLENFNLLSSGNSIIQNFNHDIKGEKETGSTVVTTLRPDIQKAASDAIGDNKGCAIVMNPKTGQILGMVSKPDYNPNEKNTMYEQWLQYESKDSVLINRATQGLYPPGSTFKILTAIEYIKEHPDYESYEYDCTGSAYVEGGTSIPCYNSTVHGHETLETAFANSCNSAFSTLGLSLDKKSFRKLCDNFMFNKALNIGMESSVSSFVLNEDSGISEVQETSIGQGKTLISPIHNLMITATIANDGKMVQPYLVDRVETASGTIVKQNRTNVIKDVITLDEAALMKEYMRTVVTQGTATSFRYAPYEAAGKTGSAQYDDSDIYHSWFVGFAPVEDPQVAICVILEGGYGYGYSAQIVARSIMDEYFN